MPRNTARERMIGRAVFATARSLVIVASITGSCSVRGRTEPSIHVALDTADQGLFDRSLPEQANAKSMNGQTPLSHLLSEKNQLNPKFFAMLRGSLFFALLLNRAKLDDDSIRRLIYYGTRDMIKKAVGMFGLDPDTRIGPGRIRCPMLVVSAEALVDPNDYQVPGNEVMMQAPGPVSDFRLMVFEELIERGAGMKYSCERSGARTPSGGYYPPTYGNNLYDTVYVLLHAPDSRVRTRAELMLDAMVASGRFDVEYWKDSDHRIRQKRAIQQETIAKQRANTKRVERETEEFDKVDWGRVVGAGLTGLNEPLSSRNRNDEQVRQRNREIERRINAGLTGSAESTSAGNPASRNTESFKGLDIKNCMSVDSSGNITTDECSDGRDSESGSSGSDVVPN